MNTGIMSLIDLAHENFYVKFLCELLESFFLLRLSRKLLVKQDDKGVKWKKPGSPYLCSGDRSFQQCLFYGEQKVSH
jgi:hypothetical protein